MSEWARLYAECGGTLLFDRQHPDSVASRIGAVAQIYLATPYTKRVTRADGQYCPDANRFLLFEAAGEARRLSLRGLTAVSPIALAAAMAEVGAAARDGALDPLDAVFWEGWCRPILRASRAVVVPALDGWTDSVGVLHEARSALATNVPVYCYGEIAWAG